MKNKTIYNFSQLNNYMLDYVGLLNKIQIKSIQYYGFQVKKCKTLYESLCKAPLITRNDDNMLLCIFININKRFVNYVNPEGSIHRTMPTVLKELNYVSLSLMQVSFSQAVSSQPPAMFCHSSESPVRYSATAAPSSFSHHLPL